MKIEYAITHAEEVASRMCDECGKQHRQLASWLKELVRVRAENAKLKPHLDRITAAWEKFDAVQKEIAKDSGVAPWELDICKSEMPPAFKDAICEECAAKIGKVPVARPVGHWTGYCDFCGQAKPLSSLSHDYVDKK